MDAPPGRRRARSRIALGLLAGLLLAAAVWAVVEREEIGRFVTHRRGGPSETWAWEDHPTSPELRLAVAGDTGKPGPRLDAVAEAMDGTAGTDAYDALLLLGDNVYPDGNLALLDEAVFEPFGPVLDDGADLLAVLGNHDVMRGTGDEMMRRLGQDGRTWSWTRGEVLVVGLDTTAVDDEQIRWLDRTLAASDETWRIVALHHPPYSAGYHGPEPALRDTVVPVLERHDVQLALSGHEHDYQRSDELDGVTYVISGGGSKTRRTGTDPDIAVAYSWHHFVDVAVYDDRMVLRAVGANGRVFDEATLRP